MSGNNTLFGRFRVVPRGLRWGVEDQISNLPIRDALVGPFWLRRSAQRVAMALHLTRRHAHDEARDTFRAEQRRGATP